MNQPSHIIGLLLANDTDRRLLADFLQGAGHTTRAPAPSAADLDTWDSVSLIIADPPSARRYERELTDLKSASRGVFLPMLIALPPDHGNDTHWLEAGFDDVLRLPVTKAELTARLDVLLRVREQSQALAAHSKQMYRALVEQSLVGVDLVIDGRIEYVNQAWCEMFGYAPEEVVGKLRPLDLVHPADRPLIQARTEARRAGETVSDHHTLRAIHKNGSVIHLDIFGQQVDYRGRPAILSTLVDVTERVQAEEALRRSEELHRLTLSNISDAIFITDDAGVFTYVCPNVSIIFGYTADDVRRFGSIAHLLGDDLFDPRELDAAGEISNIERTITDKAGTEHTLLITVKRMSVDGGTTLYTCRDITERKAAEEQLRFQANILRNVRDSVIVTATDGIIQYWNQGAEDVFGYTAKEAIGQTIGILYPQRTQGQFAADLEQVLREGQYAGVWQGRRKDGAAIWIDVRTTPMYDAEGTLVGSIGVSKEVTERIRAERALRESEQKYRSVVERANDGIIILQNGIVKYANPRLADLWGGRVEDLIDTPFAGYVHPDALPELMDRYQRRMAGEDVPAMYETELRRKDSQPLYLEINAAIITYEGKPASLVIVRDITERKEAEDALRDSEARFQRIARATNDALWEWDLHTDAVWWNEGFYELFGYPPDEADYDAPWWDEHIHPQDQERVISSIRAALQQPDEQSWEEEYRFQRADGTYAHVLDRGFVSHDENGEPVRMTGGIMDVTERVEAEEALRKSETRLRALVGSIDEIVFELDAQGTYLNVWTADESLLARPADEMLGQRVRDVLGVEFARPFEEIFRRVLATGQSETLEYHLDTMAGPRWFLARINPIPTPDGKSQTLSFLARDITERKEMEEALRESEEQYRLLAENVTDVIWTTDLDLTTTYVSPSIEQLLGYTPEELLSLPLEKTLTPCARQKVRAALAEIFQEGGSAHTREPVVRTLELELRHKDGSTVWAEVKGTILRDETGQPTGLLGVSRDITERRQAEEALRESEERYRTLYANAPVGLFSTTPDGRILNVNLAIVDMLGYPDRASLTASNVLDHYVDPKRRQHWQRIVSREGRVDDFEVRLRRRDGEIIWALLSLRAIRDDTGDVVRYEGSLKDITARKRAETALRESEEQYRTLVENAQLSTIIYQNGRVAFANPGAAEMFGYSVAELTSLSPEETAALAHPEDRQLVQKRLRDRLAGQPAPSRYEFRAIRKDGTVCWLDHTATRIEYQGQPAIQTMGIDITERKRAEAQLREHAERTEALAEISQLLAETRLDYAAVLELIAQQAAELIGDTCVVTLLSDDGEWVNPVAFYHPDPAASALMEELYANTTLNTSQPPTNVIFATGQPLRIPEVSDTEVAQLVQVGYEAWLDKVGLHSLLIVPLRAQDKIIGTLGLTRDEPGQPYTADDERFLQELADRAALAIQNARLFEAEETAHERAEILRAANVALTETLDLNAVLDTLLEHLRRLVPYDTASVLLWEAGSHMAVRAIRGHEAWTDPELVRQIIMDADALPHFRKLITSQESILIPDTAQDSGWRDDVPGTEYIRNWLGIPLIAGGDVIGVYGMDKAKPDFFTQEHVRLAEALAAQAAVAIQNARLFEQVRAGRERLQTLSQKLVEVQETERRRLARELHDEVGQMLTGLDLSLALAKRRAPDEVHAELNDAQTLVSDLIAQVRSLSLDLRPPMLDDMGLLPTLLWHLQRYTDQTQIEVDFSHSGLSDQRFRPNVESGAYRIVQEALTNVARHAGVQEASVRAWTDAGTLYLRIEDQGVGFDPEAALAAADTGGLAGSYERAALLGGQLIIESAPGAGTSVTAELPLIGRLERREHVR